jgi:hypothetical protein
MAYFLLKHNLIPSILRKFALRYTTFDQVKALMTAGVARTVAKNKEAAERVKQ